uniref:Coiled-coil domain-containing protein 40 n=1 Tax=Denticeps clupeoides TaxID=299321 RepID=A0AAY4AGM5_9TELE
MQPLMKRFQSALKTQLSKQLETLDLELREKDAMERALVAQLEEVSLEVYSAQMHLAQLQAGLERKEEAYQQAAAQRQQAQDQLEVVRKEHSAISSWMTEERSQVTQRQMEVEKLARHVLYMQDASKDMHSDVIVTKNASQKAKAEKIQAEEQMRNQDLYVERLTKELEKLTEQEALYDVQIAAQSEETRAIREVLEEAQMELETLAVERRQLIQQGNSSLVELRRRDEAHSAAQEALRLARQHSRSLDTEMEGYKKSIMSEEERNELLTVRLNRAELDVATSRKLIAQSLGQQEALQSQYSTHSRMLKETENILTRMTVESSVKKSELAGLKKQLEKESALHQELEEKIVATLQEQLATDNAAKSSRRLMDKMAAHMRDREAQLLQVENDMAQVSLECSEVSSQVESKAKQMAELEEEIVRQQELLSASEAQISRCVIDIERKQATINLYNKKIHQIVAKTGIEDLGPLEIRANSLTKQLEDVGAEIKAQQYSWLQLQGDLMRWTQEKEALSSEVQSLQTEISIKQQRMMLIQNEITQEQQEQTSLERQTNALNLDLQKLNSLLSQKNTQQQTLKQDNILMENEFLHDLKEAERKSVEMQMKLEKLQEEKDRLRNSLVEAERQVLLWEKNIQLVKETRLDSKVGQEEIRSMKAELHHKEVLYGQLMKKQERLMREMEAAVTRRDSIVTQSEALASSERKQRTQADLHLKLCGLRRKLAESQKQVDECDRKVAELKESQITLSSELKEKKQRLFELNSTNTALAEGLRGLQDTKDMNLIRLVALQKRAKKLQQPREGRHSAGTRDGDELASAVQRLREQLDTTASFLQRVCQDFPEHQEALRRVNLTVAALLLDTAADNQKQ